MRFDGRIIPDKIARLMNADDRRALEVKLPEERKLAADAMTEKEMQSLCEQYLSLRGIVYLHLSPMAREKIGWPDLTFVIRGVPCAVELKTPCGRVTEDQERMLNRMKYNGWRTAVIRSVETFYAFVRELL
jgi:hypothetical protein